MKKRLAAFTAAMALLLSGCGTESEAETETCFRCGERIDRWIPYSNSDFLCARCFVDDRFLVCRECGFAYRPVIDEGGADGYCGSCAETKTWYCSICENRIDLDELADFGNGYYLCGRCLLNQIEVPDGMADDLANCSMFISRNEYLENIND